MYKNDKINLAKLLMHEISHHFGTEDDDSKSALMNAGKIPNRLDSFRLMPIILTPFAQSLLVDATRNPPQISYGILLTLHESVIFGCCPYEVTMTTVRLAGCFYMPLHIRASIPMSKDKILIIILVIVIAIAVGWTLSDYRKFIRIDIHSGQVLVERKVFSFTISSEIHDTDVSRIYLSKLRERKSPDWRVDCTFTLFSPHVSPHHSFHGAVSNIDYVRLFVLREYDEEVLYKLACWNIYWLESDTAQLARSVSPLSLLEIFVGRHGITWDSAEGKAMISAYIEQEYKKMIAGTLDLECPCLSLANESSQTESECYVHLRITFTMCRISICRVSSEKSFFCLIRNFSRFT